MKSRRNLSGIFIMDTLEGEEKPSPTCLEDCTETRRKEWLNTLDKEALIRCADMLCETIREFGDLLDIYKE